MNNLNLINIIDPLLQEYKWTTLIISQQYMITKERE